MRRSIGYGAYGAFGVTDEQLSILGGCASTNMPCVDSSGTDLWPLVAHLTPEQKATLGRCPNINMPCMHPPGDPNGVDLWQVARSAPAPTPAPPMPGMPAASSNGMAPMSMASDPMMPPPDFDLPPDIVVPQDEGMGRFVGIGAVVLLLAGVGIYFAMR